MNKDEANNIKNSLISKLIEKKEILLTVNITTEEQANEILQWMYGNDKPMKTELLELSWDKSTVSTKEAELLNALKQTLLENYFNY